MRTHAFQCIFQSFSLSIPRLSLVKCSLILPYHTFSCHACLTSCTSTFSTPDFFSGCTEMHQTALWHLVHSLSLCFLIHGCRASTASLSRAEPEHPKHVDAALGLPPFLFALSTKDTQSDFLLRVSILIHTLLPQSRYGGCKLLNKP